LFFAGGIVLVILGIGGFFATLIGKSGMVQLHLSCTLPMIMAFGCFSAAYAIARAPRSVAVDQSGITVASSKSSRQLPWDKIAWAETATQAMTNRKLLKIYGNDGKTLTTLSPDLMGFEQLTQLVIGHLKEYPSPHMLNVRWRKAKRRGAGLIAGGIFACALASAVAWIAWDEHHSAALLQSNPVTGEGIVERKFIAPDGSTHRIEYRVASGSRSDTHNVQVEIPLWETLKTGDRLPIKTVPDHPEISQLVSGEVKDDFRPPANLTPALATIVFLMGIFFFIGGIMSRRGIDLKFDSKTRKFRIERIGKIAP
jgi:hypothetical protein